MANSSLLGKKFDIPDKILEIMNINLKKYSDTQESRGYKRANFLVGRKYCTYEQLKRIKNYYDNITEDNFDEIEYNLNGGKLMKQWVENTLNQARGDVSTGKAARTNAGMSNQYRNDPDTVNFSTDDTLPPNVLGYPNILSNSALLEEVNKIKKLINKL